MVIFQGDLWGSASLGSFTTKFISTGERVQNLAGRVREREGGCSFTVCA